MPLIQPNEIIDLKAPIRLHHWNKINNTIIALLEEEGHLSIIKINGGNTAETEKRQLPDGYALDSAREIVLSDDGNSILFFMDSHVYLYSWISRHVISLKQSEFSNEVTFDGGGFLNNNQVWVRLRDYNSFYLVHWDLTKEEWNWTNLAVHIRIKHFEEGGNFDCFRLEVHPSKKMFLGVADFDHGGYCSKLFYLVPPDDRRIKFIHPQGLAQEIEFRRSHVFNLNGDKIACLKVLNTNSDDPYQGSGYEVVVYSLDDFTKPLHSYQPPKQMDDIEYIRFLANDDFILISYYESFLVVDLFKNKIIYKNKRGDLRPQTGSDQCSFCSIKNTSLHFYKIETRPVTIKDPLEVADKFIWEHEVEIQLTNPVKTKFYPKVGLVPLLSVYHEFYHGSFDIRTRRTIDGKLPEYVLEEVRIWLDQNQETQLLKWEETINLREKYTLETEVGPLYFYSTLESERSEYQISIHMVFESTSLCICLNNQYHLDDIFPPEISQAGEQWLMKNFEMISEPWKELPHFPDMKKRFFEKEEEYTPKSLFEKIDSNPFNEVSRHTGELDGLSFWQKILRFLRQ